MKPKYKVWDSKNNKWLDEEEDLALIFPDGTLGTVDPLCWDGGVTTNEDYTKHLIVVFYTGLKDSKSVEIYKGDICGYGEKDPSIFEVVWQFNGWAKKYNGWDNSLSYPLISITDLDIIGIEVIGNKYENPKLWKKYNLKPRTIEGGDING